MVLLDECNPEAELGKINIEFNQIFDFFYLDLCNYDEECVFNENKYKQIRERLPDEYNDDWNESNSNTSETNQSYSSWNSSSSDMVQSTSSSSSDYGQHECTSNSSDNKENEVKKCELQREILADSSNPHISDYANRDF